MVFQHVTRVKRADSVCGIAGVFGLSRVSLTRRISRGRCACASVIAVQMGRGPRSLHDVALGMVRLAIVDVEHGKQPMLNDDGAVALVFNGEIYNAPALRRELQDAGVRFHTRSDTEVILRLYERDPHDVEAASRGHVGVLRSRSTSAQTRLESRSLRHQTALLRRPRSAHSRSDRSLVLSSRFARLPSSRRRSRSITGPLTRCSRGRTSPTKTRSSKASSVVAPSTRLEVDLETGSADDDDVTTSFDRPTKPRA